MRIEFEQPKTTSPYFLNTLGPHSLRQTPIASQLHIGNSTLQRARQIGMEQRLVESMDGRDSRRDTLASKIAAAARAGGFETVRDRFDFDAAVSHLVLRALAFEFLLVDVVLGGRGGAVGAPDFGDAEDGLPAFEARSVALRGGEAEAGGGEGPFGPAVVDAGEVPVYPVRGGVAVELVADVDEVLHGCYVDVVDGGEIEDDGFESGLVGFDGDGFAATRAGVVPGAVLSRVLIQCYTEIGVERRNLRRVWGRWRGWCGGSL